MTEDFAASQRPAATGDTPAPGDDTAAQRPADPTASEPTATPAGPDPDRPAAAPAAGAGAEGAGAGRPAEGAGAEGAGAEGAETSQEAPPPPPTGPSAGPAAGSPGPTAGPSAGSPGPTPGPSAGSSGPAPGPAPGPGPGPAPGVAPPPGYTGSAFPLRHGLVRPRQGRYLAGVCAAIGRATNTDPVLWRVLLAVLGFFGGIGILVYLALWLITPAEGDSASPVEGLLGRGRSSTSPILVIVLGMLVALVFGLIVTDGFRAVLLGAAVLIGGALLLNRNSEASARAAAAGAGPVPGVAPWPPPTPPAGPGTMPAHAPAGGMTTAVLPRPGAGPGPAVPYATGPYATIPGATGPGAAIPDATGPGAADPDATDPGVGPTPQPPPIPSGPYPQAPYPQAPYPHGPYPQAPDPQAPYPQVPYGAGPYPPAVDPSAARAGGYAGPPAPTSAGAAGGSGEAVVPPSLPTPPGGYRPPFAPYGPYAGGGAPPGPPPPPPVPPVPVPPPAPKPPKERSRLGAATFFLALIVLGVVAALDLYNSHTIGPSAYIFAALVTVALGLLVGAWFGRARWLIALGLVLSLALGIATTAESFDEGNVGSDVVWRVDGLDELGSRYENNFGDAVLDLSAIDFTGQQRQVTAEVNFGKLEVIVPPEVDVLARAEVGVGEARIFDETRSGLGQTITPVRDLGSDGAGGGELELRIIVNAGDAEVHR